MTYQQLIFLINRVCEKHIEYSGYDLKMLTIVGSQSILFTHKKPRMAMSASSEIDVLLEKNLYDDKTQFFLESIEFNSGTMSPFAESTGLEIDMVSDRTLITPNNWKERRKFITAKDEPLLNTNTEINYIEQHDLMLTKLRAGRDKDLDFVEEQFHMNSMSSRVINKTLREDIDLSFFCDSDGKINDDKNYERFKTFSKRLIRLYDTYLGQGKAETVTKIFSDMENSIFPTPSIKDQLSKFKSLNPGADNKNDNTKKPEPPKLT